MPWPVVASIAGNRIRGFAFVTRIDKSGAIHSSQFHACVMVLEVWHQRFIASVDQHQVVSCFALLLNFHSDSFGDSLKSFAKLASEPPLSGLIVRPDARHCIHQHRRSFLQFR